jgi:hypothetical protein
MRNGSGCGSALEAVGRASVSAAERVLRRGRNGLARLDLLDLGAQCLKIFGGGIATQRLLDLSSARFQEFAGVLEVSGRCDGWTLLDGPNGLGQARRLRFETLQAGIKPLPGRPARSPSGSPEATKTLRLISQSHIRLCNTTAVIGRREDCAAFMAGPPKPKASSGNVCTASAADGS